MTGDSSSGPETTGRTERVERSDPTDPGLPPVGAAPSAVKEPPATPFRPDRPRPETPSWPVPPGPGSNSSRPGSGRPTEVYDQVKRQWVTVGGPTPGDPGPTTVVADPGAVVTALPQTAPRKARLVLRTVDPWSVMKLSFVLSLAGAIVLLVSVWLLWLLLSTGGVFVSVDKTVGDIAGSTTSFSILDILSLRRVMGVTLMLAVVEVVLVTALATLGAFLYNLSAGLVGGVDITLTEER